jgi:CDP-diacylglycerol--serine O-phosphatidyltransferase
MQNKIPQRRPATIALLPTLFTLGNGVCGFGSLTLAAHEIDPAKADERVFFAGLLVFAAMAFDLLDGLVARLIRQTSRFGAQLDSLCDAVSFGLAPAFLVLKSTYFYHHRFLWGICVLYVVCVLIRLARYNSEVGEESPHDSFSGLPSPAAAGMIASFAVSTPSMTQLAQGGATDWMQRVGYWLGVASDVTLPVMTVVVALLMVSRVRYPHFNQFLTGRAQLHRVVQIVFAIVAACAVHELALPVIFLVFVIGSPIRAAWTRTVERGPTRGRVNRPGRRIVAWRPRRLPSGRSPIRSWRSQTATRPAARSLEPDPGNRDDISQDPNPRK